MTELMVLTTIFGIIKVVGNYVGQIFALVALAAASYVSKSLPKTSNEI